MNPNDYQIAGTHYATEFQHWDLLPALGFGPEYFIAAATKYISRHKAKGGSVDVQKAIHYMEKLIQLCRTDAMHPRTTGSAFDSVSVGTLRQWFEVNGIDPASDEADFCLYSITGHTVEEYERAITSARRILARQYATPSVAEPAALAETPRGVAEDRAPLSRTIGTLDGVPVKELPTLNFFHEGFTQGNAHWQCKRCKAHLTLPVREHPADRHSCDGSAPGPGYVDQARDASPHAGDVAG